MSLVSYYFIGLLHGKVRKYYCSHKFITPTTTKPSYTEMHKSEFTEFLVMSLCLKANAEMVPKIPSCHHMLLM